MVKPKALLKLSDVSFGFDNNSAVIENVNLDLNESEIGVLMGMSGAGKTTLCRCITGLLTPNSGTISVGNCKIYSPTPLASISFQDYSLFPWLSVRKNILIGEESGGIRVDSQRFDEITESLAITNLLERRPNQLSGGQKQRVSIARSLLRGAKLCILDEPFSALDIVSKSDVMQSIKSIRTHQAVSFLIVLHSIEDAFEVADRVFVLIGDPATLIELDIAKTFEEFKRSISTTLEQSHGNG